MKGRMMMIKASKLAIAIAAVASLGIATMKASLATPVTASANMTIPSAMSEVVDRGYFVDDSGSYVYRPAYTYRGYTYWYPNSTVYPGDQYYYNWW
jgi:hypothetical protein